MNKLFIIATIFLLGCSNSDVSVTQTGNPPKVSIGITINNDTASSNIMKAIYQRSDAINSINITSAIFVVDEIELKGSVDTLEFESDRPFVANLIPNSSSSTVILDTVEVEIGQQFEKIEMSISKLTTDLDSSLYDSLIDMRELSFVIKGFLNGDNNNVFEFKSFKEEDKIVDLSTPISVKDNTQKQMLMVLDIKKWFIDSTGSILNPLILENKSEIEATILGSIHEEHEDEESEED